MSIKLKCLSRTEAARVERPGRRRRRWGRHRLAQARAEAEAFDPELIVIFAPTTTTACSARPDAAVRDAAAESSPTTNLPRPPVDPLRDLALRDDQVHPSTRTWTSPCPTACRWITAPRPSEELTGSPHPPPGDPHHHQLGGAALRPYRRVQAGRGGRQVPRHPQQARADPRHRRPPTNRPCRCSRAPRTRSPTS